jgi:hypothetical protein
MQIELTEWAKKVRVSVSCECLPKDDLLTEEDFIIR